MEIHMTTIQELVINFHMTEACNYRCGYCYATWQDNSAETELHHAAENIHALLLKLADYFFADNSLRQTLKYQSVRINFAGGEPVMLGSRFIDAILFAKQLGFATSIITNGHLLSTAMLKKIAVHLDMLGISFDTGDYLIAQSIGRVDRKQSWLSPDRVLDVVTQYRALNPKGKVKINTVINAYNWRENLTQTITQLKPDKWKLLRVLPVYSKEMTVSQWQYESYVHKHQVHADVIVVEDNDDMWQSYLMINPEGRFYQNAGACKGLTYSPSVLEAGVEEALKYINFNAEAFSKRYQSIHLPLDMSVGA